MSSSFRLLAGAAYVLCVCAGNLQTADAQGAPVVARVFVAKDATDTDVLRIRDNVVAFGGTVKGYARGDVFVIVVAPEMLPALASVQKVEKVDLMPGAQPTPVQARAAAPLSARERVDMMLRNCSPAPTPQRAQRIAELAKAAPKVAPTSLSQRRGVLSGATGAPPSADNSLSPHFPPIGDQEGRSSCVAWAAGYYWSTYTQAADEGLDVSGVWLPRDPPCEILTNGKFDPIKFAACLPTIKDPPRPSRATESIASPAFLYPLIRTTGTSNGQCTDDGGAYLTEAMARLGIWGIGSWRMKPYDPWRFDAVVYEWPTEEQWVEALQRRTAQTFAFQISTPSGLADLKQHLANGNLAVARWEQYDNLPYWGWDRSCQDQPGACPGMSNDVLYSNASSNWMGGHAITIVGYDDVREYFDAAGQSKRGALLIANSGTPDWGAPNTAGGASKGFFWMAYDYAQAYLTEVGYNSDRPAYRPHLYAAARVAAPDRDSAMLYAGVGIQTDNPAYYWFASPYARYITPYNVFPSPSDCARHPNESDKRMVIDMTDGVPQIAATTPVPLLFVTFNSYLGGTLGPADFFYDRAGNGSFAKLASPDTTKMATANSFDAVMCTEVIQTGDITGDGFVDRTDIAAITAGLSRPAQCRSDPRDMDRDGRITVLDARRAAMRCTYPGCAPR
jgi:hypothetical protein